jgi:uncharacterized protein DUF6789
MCRALRKEKYDIRHCKIFKGILAGLAATLALTLLMMMKKITGAMPELDPINMLATMVSEKMGVEKNLIFGWVMHFMMGSVLWGGLFAIFHKLFPTENPLLKGMVFSVVPWFLMMTGAMPMSGAGLFGIKISIMVPFMTFAFHMVFGATLGKVFALLGGADESR